MVLATKRMSRGIFASTKVLREHSQRSRAVARALDAKTDVLPHASVLTSVELAEFLSHLTPNRLALLRLTVKRGRSIGELATALDRDPRAVSRDVAKLEKLGLVSAALASTSGHGKIKVVTVVAARVAIFAGPRARREDAGARGL